MRIILSQHIKVTAFANNYRFGKFNVAFKPCRLFPNWKSAKNRVVKFFEDLAWLHIK